jgi:hypothetical protein
MLIKAVDYGFFVPPNIFTQIMLLWMSKGSPVVEHSTHNPEVQGLNLAAYTGKKYTDSCMEVPLLQIIRGSTVVVHSTYDAEIEGFNTDARTG